MKAKNVGNRFRRMFNPKKMFENAFRCLLFVPVDTGLVPGFGGTIL